MNISVAMCTYNGSQFLEEQLSSISAQERKPFELVICDDGSTDSTARIVEAFSETAPFPVHFHRNLTNLGSTRNFQKAIQLCRGDFIALCDQDDYWQPQKLGGMCNVLELNPQLAGIFSNARLIDERGTILQGDLWQRSEFPLHDRRKFTKEFAPYRLITRDTVTGATLIFRASYIPVLVPFSSEWMHDGWIAMILASVAELRAHPVYDMHYRLHAAQQVGLTETAWSSHLSTRKEKALEFHLQMVRRLSAITARLETLSVDPDILVALRRKRDFYAGRSQILRSSRAHRLIGLTRLIPGYFAHEKGILSLLRDLLH